MTPRDIVILAFALLVGACIGSFVNVVIHRLPCELDEPNDFGELWDTHPWRSVLAGDSHCADCCRRLTVTDLIPVLSWIALRGRCRHCGARIAAYHPLVELAVPALGVVAWQVAGWGWRLPLVLLLVPIGLAVSIIDLRTMMVPTRLVWPALGAVVATSVLVAVVVGHPGWLFNGAIGVAGLAGPLFLIWFILPSGMGFGDVRLATLLGWCVGFSGGGSLADAVLLALVALGGSAVLGVILGVAVLGARGRKAKVPFGPSLCLASWGCMLVAGDLVANLLHSTP